MDIPVVSKSTPSSWSGVLKSKLGETHAVYFEAISTVVKIILSEVIPPGAQRTLGIRMDRGARASTGTLRLRDQGAFELYFKVSTTDVLTVVFSTNTEVRKLLDGLERAMALYKSPSYQRKEVSDKFVEDIKKTTAALEETQPVRALETLLVCMWSLNISTKVNIPTYSYDRIIRILTEVRPELFPTPDAVMHVIAEGKSRDLLTNRTLTKERGIGISQFGRRYMQNKYPGL